MTHSAWFVPKTVVGMAGEAVAQPPHANRLLDGACRLIRLFSRWRERARQRDALAALDDRLLRDIGITRVDVRRECDKPFWR